jgi:hypothetical protein
MADNLPDWAKTTENLPDWAKSASQEKSATQSLDRPAEPMGTIDDIMRVLARGATLGYADEIAAKLDELTGRGKPRTLSGLITGEQGGTSYEANLQRQRARTAAIPTAVQVPGEIVGGVLGAMAAAPETGAIGAYTGLSRLPGWLKATLGGAGVGAVYGSETGEGVEGRTRGAVEGGATGAVLGPAVYGGTRLYQHLRDPTARAMADLQRAVLRDRGIQRTVPAERAGIATLPDVYGENVRGLLERLAQTPGAGRTTVFPSMVARQEPQLVRTAEDLKSLLGTRQTAQQSIKQQLALRTKEATPAYKAAYDAGDRLIWNDELERLSAVPEVQSAMHGAVSGWQRSQIAQGYGAMNPGATITPGGMMKFLHNKVPVHPNLQFWDYTKQALDDMISHEINPEGEITRKGRDLTIIAEKMRGALDKEVPEYATARQVWAGPSGYIRAIKEGGRINKLSAEELHGTINGYASDAEREAFRVGALNQLFRKMGSSTAKLADITVSLRSPEMRGKISALMPNAQAAAKWDRILGFEIGSSEMVKQTLTGSPTARRLAEQGAANMVGDMVADLAMGGHPLSLLTKIGRATVGKVRDTIRSRTDAELAKLLTQPLSERQGVPGLIQRLGGADAAQ